MSDLLAEPCLPVRTSDIKAAMRATYCQPEWALFFEVGDGTGAACRRHADAVAMNMYPSRGLAIHGFEFKASKSDWKRELADPSKAEAIAQYCDHWSVVTSPNVVGPGELPATWGLIEVRNGKLLTRVAAKPHEAIQPTRAFIAAMLRSQAKVDEAEISALVEAKLAPERERTWKQVDQRVRERTAELEQFKERHAAFVEAMKNERYSYKSEEQFAAALQCALSLNLTGDYGELKTLMRNVRHMHEVLTGACKALGVENPA